MRRLFPLILAGLLALALASCGLIGRSEPTPEPSPTPSPTPSEEPTASPSPSPSPTPTSEPLPETAFAALSPEFRAAQLIMVAISGGVTNAAVDHLVGDRGVGSVLYLSSGWDMAATAAASAHVASLPHPQGVGLFIAADQEGGRIQRLQGPGFDPIPAATEQGTWGPDELRRQAAAWGLQLQAAGVNLDLAPVADTVAGWQAADNAPIGALNRQFGEDPTVVGAQAAAFIEGMKSVGVATAVKHFPGLGRVTGNTDFTAVGVVDTTTDFDDPVVAAFATAMAAEPGLVMVSLATYAQVDPHNPAAFSPIIVTDWLRGRLGWQGVVISDSLTASAVAHVPVSERAVRFIDAGGDIAIFATAAEAAAALDGIIAQMAVSPEFAVKANAAAWRVLVAKSALGLVPLS